MTYIVGINSRSGVYVFADSLVTERGEPKELGASSTLGESLASIGAYSFSDRSMKIVRYKQCVFAFCGSVDSGRRLIDAVQTQLQITPSPEEAFARALEEVQTCLVPGNPTLLVAVSDGNIARLFVLNEVIDKPIEEILIESAVHFGSLPPEEKEKLSIYPLWALQNELTGAHCMAVALAGFHACSVNDYLVEKGVGGAFTGIHITGSEIHWQPDCFFIIHPPNFSQGHEVATGIRHDSLIVRSTFTGSSRIIASSQTSTQMEELFQFYQECQTGTGVWPDNRFDYVTMIRLGIKRIAIFEMRRQHQSGALKMVYETLPNGDRKTAFGVSPEASKWLRSSGNRNDLDVEIAFYGIK